MMRTYKKSTQIYNCYLSWSKIFNVIVINYKNSSIYVQRQIDRLFRLYRHFVKTHIDNIVIYFKNFNEYKIHFRKIFDMFNINNIFVKSKKTFYWLLDNLFVKLKNKFFKFDYNRKKLKTISRLSYFKNLQILKIYLNFIEWFRNYVFMYIDFTKSF